MQDNSANQEITDQAERLYGQPLTVILYEILNGEDALSEAKRDDTV